MYAIELETIADHAPQCMNDQYSWNWHIEQPMLFLFGGNEMVPYYISDIKRCGKYYDDSKNHLGGGCVRHHNHNGPCLLGFGYSPPYILRLSDRVASRIWPFDNT